MRYASRFRMCGGCYICCPQSHSEISAASETWLAFVPIWWIKDCPFRVSVRRWAMNVSTPNRWCYLHHHITQYKTELFITSAIRTEGTPELQVALPKSISWKDEHTASLVDELYDILKNIAAEKPQGSEDIYGLNTSIAWASPDFEILSTSSYKYSSILHFKVTTSRTNRVEKTPKAGRMRTLTKKKGWVIYVKLVVLAKKGYQGGFSSVG